LADDKIGSFKVWKDMHGGNVTHQKWPGLLKHL